MSRLLDGVRADGRAVSAPEHLQRYGPLPRSGRELIAELQSSGLRGRGGGAFPTGDKLAAVAAREAAGRSSSSTRPRASPPVPRTGCSSDSFRISCSTAPRPPQAHSARARSSSRWPRRGGAVERGIVAAALRGAARDSSTGRSPRSRTVSSPARRRLSSTRSTAKAGEAERQAAVSVRARRGRCADARPERGDARARRTDRTVRRRVVSLARDRGRARDRSRQRLRAPSRGRACTRSSSERAISEVIVQAGGVTEPISASLVGGYFGGWTRDPKQQLTAAGRARRRCRRRPSEERLRRPRERPRDARFLAGESAGQCGPCVHGLEALATGLEDRSRTGRAVTAATASSAGRAR